MQRRKGTKNKRKRKEGGKVGKKMKRGELQRRKGTKNKAKMRKGRKEERKGKRG